jgi:spore maturation protein CgeB
MKFLIMTGDQPEFISWFYAGRPGLAEAPFDTQLAARMDTQFMWADYYSRALRDLGHEAHEFIPNNETIQRAWATEYGFSASPGVRREFRMRRGVVPWWCEVGDSRWLEEIAEEQIRQHRPDVLLVRIIDLFSRDFLQRIRPYVGRIIGQHASPIKRDRDYSDYDLMITSLPNYVEYFRGVGVNCELVRLGFEPAVLERLRPGPKTVDASFVGALADDHKERTVFLEALCSEAPVQLWGSRLYGVAADSIIRQRYRGPAWGLEMFQLLCESKVVVNHHEAWADRYANNMRLFECTGVGSLLITDWKCNLSEMFEPGKEVVTYRTPEECAEAVKYYLEHEQEREEIARAGQKRTLRDHTYRHRMEQFVKMIEPLF